MLKAKLIILSVLCLTYGTMGVNVELPLCPTDMPTSPQELPMHCRMPNKPVVGPMPFPIGGPMSMYGPMAMGQPPMPFQQPMPMSMPPFPGSMIINHPLGNTTSASPSPPMMPGLFPMPYQSPPMQMGMPPPPLRPQGKPPVIIMPFYSQMPPNGNNNNNNNNNHNSNNYDDDLEAEYRKKKARSKQRKRKHDKTRRKSKRLSDREELTPILQYVNKDGYVMYEKNLSKIPEGRKLSHKAPARVNRYASAEERNSGESSQEEERGMGNKINKSYAREETDSKQTETSKPQQIKKRRTTYN